MPRISYVNGRFVPHADAVVPMEDRGLQFSDGVYEVIELLGDQLIDAEPHLDRLWHSLALIEMSAPMTRPAFEVVIDELLRRNMRRHGLVYIQVNRAVARRNHLFPKGAVPSVMMTLMPARMPGYSDYAEGKMVYTQVDRRWQGADAKTVSLLPNVLAKQAAAEKGGHEAVLVSADGIVREGSLSNVMMVTEEGVLVTHPTDGDILPGITRERVLHYATQLKVPVEERPVTVAELMGMAEIFLTSTSMHILPVVAVDDTPIGHGRPGVVTLRLLHAYHRDLTQQTGVPCPLPPLPNP